MNNMDNNIPVEQLWYTWSDVGLSTIHAGFRIRAASPGLTEIYSDRVKSVERTMRYVLPPGTDRFAITPDQAPVGLAFMRSEWNNEYLLVHKKYTGADGVGRLGNFFIHAIALGEYSPYFSPEDAIWLWESKIWRTDSKELEEKDRRSTSLKTLSLIDVFDSATHFRAAQFQQVQPALQFIIAAYLMRRDRTIPLYIAAPADQVAKIAYIIAGLVNCLPAQLLTNLTFSTYEPDITKATTEIVGTSWIPLPGKENDAIFPKDLYLEKLAVNCSTQEKSYLKTHPQVMYNPLVADFAEYATNCLATGNTARLYDVRDYAESSRQNLDSAFFLQIYHTEIVNTQSMSTTEIDNSLSADWLRRENSPRKIIEAAIAHPSWSDTRLRDKLLTLREQAEKESAVSIQHGQRTLSGEPEYAAGASSGEIEPRRKSKKNSAKTKKAAATLTDTLALLASSAIPAIVTRMEQGSKLSGTTTGQNGGSERQQLVDTISVLLRLMDACLLAHDPTGVWKQLLEAIVASKQASSFVHFELTLHDWLAKMKETQAPLTSTLALLAKSATPTIATYMEQASKLPETSTGQTGQSSAASVERQKLVNAITILLRSMNACLLPQDPTGGWKQLFTKIINSQQAVAFLYSDWKIHSWLLKIWNNAFLPDPQDTEDNAKMGSLLIIPWHRLGDFLKLGLHNRHKQWIIFATQELIRHPIPTPQIAPDLAQNCSQEIATLLAILAQEKDFSTEANLITRLVEQGYPVSSGMEIHIEQLFVPLNRENNLRHSARDLILALTRAGYFGTPAYQKHVADITQNVITTTPRAGQELISVLIQHDFPLRSWMIDLLLLFEEYRTDLLRVIIYVYPTPAGQHNFFVQDGPRYLTNGAPSLSREYWVQPMVSLYQQLLSFNGKADRLFVLLDAISDPEEIFRLLTNTPLEGYETEYFLQRYGPRYLQNFQLAPKPANMIIANFTRLINSGYPNGPDLLFTIMPLQTGEIYLDRLLSLVKLTPEQQISFLERYGANYLKLYPTMPPLLEYVSTYITHFHIDALEKDATKAFFAFLTQQYKYLALDPITQSHIKCWKIIDGYFTSPDAQVPALAGLAEALPFLGLPNNRQFTEKLAQAFVFCIRTNLDLSTVMEFMRQVPKVAKEKADEYQFLYILADQAAKAYEKQPSTGIFSSYLSFALTLSTQNSRRLELFIHVFLDRLLYNIAVVHISSNTTLTISPDWDTLDAMLNTIIEPQYKLIAMERWHTYLSRLGILDELNPDAEKGSSITPRRTLPSWLKFPTIPLLHRWRKKTHKMPADNNETNDVPPIPPVPPALRSGYNGQTISGQVPPANSQYPGGVNNPNRDPSSSGISFRPYDQEYR